MKILPLTILALMASALAAAAQIAVEVTIEQEQFLREESVPIKVRITNRSGQALRLGADNEWLTFSIESLDGYVVTKIGEIPVKGEFLLESAHVATRQVDLMPGFDLSHPGRYAVTATVRIKEWNDEAASKPKPFEVIRGTKLWEQEFGLPTLAGPPEVRKYVLQQATYRKQLRLYVRISDLSDQKILRVFPIGPLVSFSQPEAQVDQSSFLHVLFQTGARSFLFQIISPEGDVVLRQTYDYAGSRPVLRLTEEGRIFVAGGARRPTANDLPKPLAEAADGASPTPVAPNSNSPTNRQGLKRYPSDDKPPGK
jgi:hypothetical protein